MFKANHLGFLILIMFTLIPMGSSDCASMGQTNKKLKESLP
jgi:hypothetical protein